MNYFIINGFNTSQLKGAIVTDFGEVEASIERSSEEVTIYGANGKLKVLDGAFNNYSRKMTIVVRTIEDVNRVVEQFTALDNEIILGYLPDSHYYCDLESATYKPLGPHRWQLDLSLAFHPFRYTNASTTVNLSNRGTVTNPGSVYSEPVIVVEGSGNVTLTIGKQLMELNLNGKATIDCRHKRQNIYDKNGAIKNSIRKRGPFFEIQPGTSGVTTTGTVTKITITGNWRYRV